MLDILSCEQFDITRGLARRANHAILHTLVNDAHRNIYRDENIRVVTVVNEVAKKERVRHLIQFARKTIYKQSTARKRVYFAFDERKNEIRGQQALCVAP